MKEKLNSFKEKLTGMDRKKKILSAICVLAVIVLIIVLRVSCSGSDSSKDTVKKAETVISEADDTEPEDTDSDSEESEKDSDTDVAEDTTADDSKNTDETSSDSNDSGSTDSESSSKKNSKSSDTDSKSSNSSSKSSGTKSGSSSSSSNNKTSNSSNTSSGGSSSSSSGSSGSSGSSNSSSSSSTATHTHNWVAQTTIVHHDATGHNEQYVVKNAWDETVQEAVYETSTKWICNQCGEDITNKIDAHMKANWDCGGYHSESVQTLVGYNTYTIHHDAEYGTRWVEDTAAYDETVTTGYKCSCGATK